MSAGEKLYCTFSGVIFKCPGHHTITPCIRGYPEQLNLVLQGCEILEGFELCLECDELTMEGCTVTIPVSMECPSVTVTKSTFSLFPHA